MNAYFVRIREEIEPEAENRFVGVFFADSAFDLGMAIDEQLDPGICEFAKVELSGEGIFISLKKEGQGEDEYLDYCFNKCTEGLGDIFESVFDESLSWHSLSSWINEYHEAIEQIANSAESHDTTCFSIDTVNLLIDAMTEEERTEFSRWQAATIFSDEDANVQNWPGIEGLLNRIRH